VLKFLQLSTQYCIYQQQHINLTVFNCDKDFWCQNVTKAAQQCIQSLNEIVNKLSENYSACRTKNASLIQTLSTQQEKYEMPVVTIF
jgi:hypothetical protein